MSNHNVQAGLVMPLVILVVLASSLVQSCCTEFVVGDLFWSIPLTNDFYSNWSSSHFFHIGDTLYFDFDSGRYNVMQVSTREYQGCTADHPFVALWDGPARIVLMEEGVFYFICSIANYCAIGQKFSVVVYRENHNETNNSSISAPTPSSSLQDCLHPNHSKQPNKNGWRLFYFRNDITNYLDIIFRIRRLQPKELMLKRWGSGDLNAPPTIKTS